MNISGIIYTKVVDHYIVGTDSILADNNAVESGKNLVIVILPRFINGVVISRIGNYSFKNNPSIKKLVVSKTIKEIGLDGISHIKTLEELTFEKDSQLETIERGFCFNIELTRFVLPPSVKSIGSYFFGKSSVQDLVYCSYVSNPENIFYDRNKGFTFPQRIHVAKNYPYSSIGDYNKSLLTDGECERIFYNKATKCMRQGALNSFVICVFLIIA